MAQYLPSDSSRLGAVLLSAMSTEDPLGIPIWQVQRRKVPIVSTLVLGNPLMRMVSFVGGSSSPYLNSIMSSSTNIVPHVRHNIISAALIPYNNVEDLVPEDLNLNKSGLPVEIGMGSLLTFNFNSTSRHRDGSLGVSYPIYEVSLTLIKILCYLKNSVLLHHTYQCDADLSVGYEPICYCLAKRTINDSELTKLNDDYESLCRYLCGSDQLPYDVVMQKFNELSDSFFKVTVELNTDPTIRSRTEGMERNHLVFGLHRTVSFCL